MIVITGVSGLVGGNLARLLLMQGHRVRGLIHRDTRAVEGLDIELVQGDVRDPEALRQAFTGARAVYHLAGSISLEMDNWAEVESTNLLGTRNVVEACLACGVQRLVHFSSIHALEQQPFDQPVDETRPRVTSLTEPPYDRSKAAGELEILRGITRGMNAVILNPTAMVGPYDYRPSYFGRALIALAQGKIPALVEGGFDWVDVRDVVAAAIQAEYKAPNGSSYILSGHWRSVRQVAEIVAGLTGKPAPALTVTLGMAYFAAPLMGWLAHLNGQLPIYTRVTLRALRSNRQISHARASRELDYHPRPFQDTLAEAIRWFQENDYISSPHPASRRGST